jgi:hypothetical protein
MKAFITPSYTFTPGASGGGTIDLSSIAGFDIKRLIAVINQTRGELIYSTGSSTLKYTGVLGGVVTLFADTSSHLSTDTLQIIYEGIGQKSSASSHAMVLSTEQEAILSAIATSAKQDAAKTVLDNSLTKLTSIDGKDFSSSAKQDLAKAVLDSIQTNTSNTSGKLPATLGQKTKAASLAVVPPSDYQSPVIPYGIDLTPTALSATGSVIASVDVSAYKVLYIQNLNTFSATVQFQGSLDGTNWTAVPGASSSLSIAITPTFTNAVLLWTVPVTFKYFRLQCTAYTSGTINVLGFASSVATTDYATKFIQPNGTVPTTSTNSTVAGTVTSAQVTVGTTAVRATVAGTAPNAARKLLMIKPSKNNTGAIYYGPSTVTTTNGMEILGPDAREFDFDSGDYYLISDLAGQTVEILEKA